MPFSDSNAEPTITSSTTPTTSTTSEPSEVTVFISLTFQANRTSILAPSDTSRIDSKATSSNDLNTGNNSNSLRSHSEIASTISKLDISSITMKKINTLIDKDQFTTLESIESMNPFAAEIFSLG